MNVTDVREEANLEGGDKLEYIFTKQSKLSHKYDEIERANGFHRPTTLPLDLHDRKDQALLKDMAWRCTEELAEALDAAIEFSWKHIKAREEIADALHFLVEFGIFAGIGPGEVGPLGGFGDMDKLDCIFDHIHHSVVNYMPEVKETYSTFIKDLGMTCHTLKNKPWKVSHMLTDVDEFKKRYRVAFGSFMELCYSIGMGSQEVFDLYFRKSEVNVFRQRSNY